MATVADLTPGGLVTGSDINGPIRAVFVARITHPEYPGLMLVIWRLDDVPGGTWSFDALRPGQDIGELARSTSRDRADRLSAVLLDTPW